MNPAGQGVCTSWTDECTPCRGPLQQP